MTLYLLFIAIPILGLLALLIAGGPKKRNSYSWVQFFAKGKDEGFSLKEIELLRRVAIRSEVEDPTALFWSVKQLDQCIKGILRKSRLTGDENSLETQDFLA
ncbi:MAG: PilZ domain-containing protein, partial [Treponemataceae bacterium]